MEKLAARLQDAGSAVTVIGLLVSLVGASFLSAYLQGMMPLLNFGEHAVVSLVVFLFALSIYILLNILVTGILYDKALPPGLRLLYWSSALVSEIVAVLGVIAASACYVVGNSALALNILFIVTLFEGFSKLGFIVVESILRRSSLVTKID